MNDNRLKITIAMSIGGKASFSNTDKDTCVSNVFYSIANQANFSSHDVRLAVVNHHSNEEQLLQRLNHFFTDKQFKLKTKECDSFSRINTLFNDDNLIDMDTDVVFYQSCDTIWFDQTILDDASHIMNNNVVVSTNTQDVPVPYDLYNKHDNYQKFHSNLSEIYNSTPHNIRARKPSKFMYLGGMQYSLFKKYSQEPFMCDLTQHVFFSSRGIAFEYSPKISIHQRHNYTVMPCLDLHNCNNKYGNKASCLRKSNKNLNMDSLKFIENYKKKYEK